MEIEFQKKWDKLQISLTKRFGGKMDVQEVLFVIGLQELGINKEKFSKDQKLEVMHIAVCTILEPFGYYKFKGRDRDAWPHWDVMQKLPTLNNTEQEQLMKQGIMDYFEKSKVF